MHEGNLPEDRIGYDRGMRARITAIGGIRPDDIRTGMIRGVPLHALDLLIEDREVGA